MLSKIVLSALLMLCLFTAAYGETVERPTGNATGRVTDIRGNPVVNIPVILFSYIGDGKAYQLFSDNQGAYSFRNIPVGKYSLQIHRDKHIFNRYENNNIIIIESETVLDVDAVLEDI